MLKRKKWIRFARTRSRKLSFGTIPKIYYKTQTKHLDYGKGVDTIELDLFHTAIWPIFRVAQCFAIMPLVNVGDPDPYRVRFKYESFGMVVTGAFLFFGGIMYLLFSSEIIRAGITANNIVGIVFFSCGFCACTLFARLARRWPQLIRYWTRVESVFLAPPYKPNHWTLKHKIRLTAGIIATLSADVYGFRMHRLACNITESSGPYADFMKDHFKFIFTYIPYNIFLTFPILFLNGTFTFMWNYMDLFIVMVSLGLAARFQQIGQRAEALFGRNVSQSTWYEIRGHYVQLCELLELVDEELSSIILLSSVNNLYFICYQILNIFNTLRWTINYIYFWYSLLYLIGRTTFVFLCAAKINDESKVPLRALRSVPAKGWGDEVERFSFHITGDCVALSGRRLFFITRKLLFGMAATIVTYELVLLQFDDINKNKHLPPLCG